MSTLKKKDPLEEFGDGQKERESDRKGMGSLDAQDGWPVVAVR